MAKGRSGKKRRPAAFQSRAWLESLTAQEQQRAPYDAMHRALIEGVLDQFSSRGQLRLEVGAGTGRLRQLLGEKANDWLHTEPDAASLRHFRQRFPSSHSEPGSAERLPVESGTLDTWVGLCVLDVVRDLPAVASEARRVLKPGGCLIHFLDMSTLLEKPLEDLVSVGLVALPNVFSDPSDELWPQDLAILPRQAAQQVLAILRQHDRPLAEAFGPYFQIFFETRFDAKRAAQAFFTLAGSTPLRTQLQMMFAEAQQLAQGVGAGEIPLATVSSAKHVAGRIRAAFEATQFEVEVDEVRTAWALHPRPTTDPLAYRSLCTGHERKYESTTPRQLLNSAAPAPSAGEQLRETGVHVFVARRA